MWYFWNTHTHIYMSTHAPQPLTAHTHIHVLCVYVVVINIYGIPSASQRGKVVERVLFKTHEVYLCVCFFVNVA